MDDSSCLELLVSVSVPAVTPDSTDRLEVCVIDHAELGLEDRGMLLLVAPPSRLFLSSSRPNGLMHKYGVVMVSMAGLLKPHVVHTLEVKFSSVWCAMS